LHAAVIKARGRQEPPTVPVQFDGQSPAGKADQTDYWRMLESEVTRLRFENSQLANQVERLKGYATHKSGCAYHYGHDCDCGVEELRK
jgi:hypothetical protein